MADTARSRRRARFAASGATVSAVALAAGVAALTRRWEHAHEPTGGDPLGVPEGHRSRVRTRDGADLHVLVLEPKDVEVPARTVVLSHCWTGDHRVWGPVARRLVDAGHPVVLYDQRGHGGSTVGADGCTLAALAADLRTVLEHVDADGVVLAGHSMGGMAAQAFAIHHPDELSARVAALALVATASSSLGHGRAPTTRVVGATVGTPLATIALGRPRLGALVVRNTVGARPALAHLGAVRETFVGTDPRARGDFFRAMEAMDLSDGLPSIDLPAVVVCGTRDWLTPQHHSERLAAGLPNARLEVLPGAGHMLPFEAPDRVAAIVRELALAVG